MKEEAPIKFVVRRAYHVALGRKQLQRHLNLHYNLPQELVDRILSVFVEAATNIVKHAKVGVVTVSKDTIGSRPALVMTFDDEGPGIKDLQNAQREGVSTAGTLGLGFKIIKNNTDEFVVENTDRGLRVKTVWFLKKNMLNKQAPKVEFLRYSVPMRGHTVGGDVVFVKSSDNGSFFGAVFDVLGHGLEANLTVVLLKKAWTWYTEGRMPVPYEYLNAMAKQIIGKNVRSAVAAAVLFDPEKKILELAGIGNITVALLVDGHFYIPYLKGGVLGEGKLSTANFQVKREFAIAMASDGFKSGWPAFFKKLPDMSIKRWMDRAINDFKRDDDDASIMVARWRSN